MRVLEATQAAGAAFRLIDGTSSRWLLIAEEAIPEASSPAVLQWRPDDAGAAWIPLAYELTHDGERSLVTFPPHGGQFRVVPAAAGAVVRVEPAVPNVFGSDVVFD